MATWRFVANGVVGNNITLALPTYDISKETRISAIVEQVRKALEWTYRCIAGYRGDLASELSGLIAGLSGVG